MCLFVCVGGWSKGQNLIYKYLCITLSDKCTMNIYYGMTIIIHQPLLNTDVLQFVPSISIFSDPNIIGIHYSGLISVWVGGPVQYYIRNMGMFRALSINEWNIQRPMQNKRSLLDKHWVCNKLPRVNRDWRYVRRLQWNAVYEWRSVFGINKKQKTTTTNMKQVNGTPSRGLVTRTHPHY